jgi:chromate transport protein ChrA
MLILLIRVAYRRVHQHPSVEGFMRGLTLAVSAISAVVLLTVLRSAGIGVATVAVTVVALAMTASKRVPIPVIFVLAGVAGIVLYGG